MAVRLLGIGWSVDVSEAARNIKCPVLVMHPERDAVVPIDEGRLLASLIPDARFVTLDSENHMPLAEEPAWAQLAGEMRAFLKAPVVASANTALPLDQLTARERAVLDGIAGGLDNSEIAAALKLSEKTVRNTLPASSTRSASSTATRRSCGRVKQASACRAAVEPGQLSLFLA
jgi:DNA-binding NarL/FixJ family response regulator